MGFFLPALVLQFQAEINRGKSNFDLVYEICLPSNELADPLRWGSLQIMRMLQRHSLSQ